MKKLIYLIVLIGALALIVAGCLPVVPPTEQNEPGSLPNKGPGDLDEVWNITNDPNVSYSTIQLAIDASATNPDDTIIVGPGTYSGFVDTKGLDIRGAQYNVDPAGTLSRGAETVITGTVKIENADNASVNGFKMTSSYICAGYPSAKNVKISYNILENVVATWGAIHLHGTASGPSYHECDGGYIGYNTISGAQGHGIWTVGNDNVIIEHNHVLDATGTAIDCLNHVGTGIIIRNNVISNPGIKGINYWGEAGAVIRENSISGSTYEAIFTDINATIIGNDIADCNWVGICLATGANGSIVSGNIISHTFYEGIQAFVPATITGNDISGCYHGIQIRNHATGTVIEWNNIHDNTYHGIEIPNYAGTTLVTGATITNNIFTNNGYTGIKVGGGTDGSGININYNGFEGNVYFGVEAAIVPTDDVSLYVDAARNWWGHASGPSGEYGRVNKQGKVIGKGDAVSNYVNWDPWLSQPTVPPTQILNKWDLKGTFIANEGYNWCGLLEDYATWEYSIHIKEAMNGDFSVGSIHFATVDNIVDIEVIGIVEQTKTSYNYSSWANWDTFAAAGRAKYDGETYNFLFLFSKHAMWFAISHCDLEPYWTNEDVWHGLDREYDLLSKIPDETFIVDPKSIH